MNPTGKLVVIGGAMDKGDREGTNDARDRNLNYYQLGIVRRILNESKGPESRVEIVPTASQIPAEIGEDFIKAFSLAGCDNTGVLNITKREEANDPEVIKRLNAADIVIFSGGDQLRLTSIYGGTQFLKTLSTRYQEEGLLIAGTSAGAAAASNSMIYQGSSSEALLKGEVKITQGLGFIDGVIIDTHFVKRGRIGRLFQAVASNPAMLGIGLGEDTGLIITDGNKMEAIGSGLVVLVDGENIRDTNLTDIPVGSPISIENLGVHVLSLYDTYNISEKKMNIAKKGKVKEPLDY
ncbi:MAG: cyanophycinase [Sphingobacteriales bacterium]|jgi:cyanophycinase